MEFRFWTIPLNWFKEEQLTMTIPFPDAVGYCLHSEEKQKMPYQRKARVGDLIKREIAFIIQRELKDPGIGFVTITGVELSSDLKQARVYYSVLGDEDSKIRSASALKRAAGFIQNEIGARLRLKYTPGIHFCFDKSVERGARIEELIQRIHNREGLEEKQGDQINSHADESKPRRNGSEDEG
jgi:ribosome-binding factor A